MSTHRPAHPLALLASCVALLLAAALPSTAGARPTDGSGPAFEPRYGSVKTRTSCAVRRSGAGGSRQVCLTWAVKGANAPPPGWVDDVKKTFKQVWNREIKKMHYRMPLPDQGGRAKPAQGPNPGLDIYLANFADGATGGYCIGDRRPDPDGDNLPGKKATIDKDDDERLAAYCVIDNDFEEFAPADPLESLQAVAAHEFFHAVQYAYDGGEPGLLIEGTAAWMEGRVFPDNHDNYNYLDTSALHQPEVPLDGQSDEPGHGEYPGFTYGSWLFWQFATDPRIGGPGLLNGLWKAAAAGSPPRDRLAYRARLARGTDTDFETLFNEFAVWNYSVGDPDSYPDGQSYLDDSLQGQRPPLDAEYQLTSSRPSTSPGFRAMPVDHLSTRYVKFRADASCDLTVTVDLPPAAASARPSLIVQSSPTAFGERLPLPAPAPTGVTSRLVPDVGPGQSLILVLSNGGDSPGSFGYRAVRSSC